MQDDGPLQLASAKSISSRLAAGETVTLALELQLLHHLCS